MYFNDPWDCKAPEITCPVGRTELNRIMQELSKQKDQDFLSLKSLKTHSTSRKKISEHLASEFERSYEGLRSKIGIFSLSFIPDSELMWSHYASGHTGYMLHFQIDITTSYIDPSSKNEIVSVPVVYENERRAWSLKDYHNIREERSYDLIRYKSKAWEYECEHRLLNTYKWGFIKTPSNWLKSIVIGISTEIGLRGELEGIGKSLNVPVLSAKMDSTEYKIDIPRLDIDGVDGRRDYEKVKKMETFNLY